MTKYLDDEHDDDMLDTMHYAYETIVKFIQDNDITCPETIAQTDRVIENAYAFITELCDIVGYKKLKESTTDEKTTNERVYYNDIG